MQVIKRHQFQPALVIFWLKQLYPHDRNERKPDIPMEIIDNDGNFSTRLDDVLSRWKSDYQNLFSNDNSAAFDEGHLDYVRNSTQSNPVCQPNIDLTNLNADISKEEVRKSIMRAKLHKAPGLDQIPAEVLRNDVCVDLL